MGHTAVAGMKNSRDAKARGRIVGCLPFSAAGQSAPILGSADVSASQRSVCTTARPKSFGQVSRGSTWSDEVRLSVLGDLAIPRSIYEKGLGGLSIPYVRLDAITLRMIFPMHSKC